MLRDTSFGVNGFEWFVENIVDYKDVLSKNALIIMIYGKCFGVSVKTDMPRRTARAQCTRGT